MKKGGAILGLLVMSILLISVISSISLVGAGLLGDVWNKITGKVTDNVTENMTSSEAETEFVLESKPAPELKRVCCKIMSVTAEPTLKYEFRLKTECGQVVTGESSEIVSDEYCVPKIPPEQCKEGEIKNYICEDGTEVPECICENDAWVCRISVKDDCPDVGSGPETCAAKIQITSNKDVYEIGDSVKIIIEIFDSQGNHLPNYAFYGQMYDDRWHTPDLQKTDDKGYFIITTTAEKPAGGVTEVKFKVYTKEISSCGSVEDIKEVKIELEECGFGECAPEPECKDEVRKCGGDCLPCPEDEDGGKDIFYPCSGCELEGKCYPYGYRKEGKYCTPETDTFVEQLTGDAKCENNFECETNLCINGNCVSSNVWNKFLGWFQNIFGKGDEEPKDCSELLIEKDINDWEYLESIYGSTKESQAPVHSKDGTYLDTIKCCMAGYKNKETSEEKATLVCPYDNRQDLENSFYWILVKEQTHGLELALVEYKGYKVYGDTNIAIVWTSDSYLVASGGDPRVGTPLSEEVTDAYLKKYPNDLDLTESDIPYIPPNPLPDKKGKSFVFCTEEDKELAKECGHSEGAPQSDPSTLERTGESKKACIESGGHAEGCCEIYTGCIMPDETCEDIEIVSKDECYWHVARLNNDASLCEKITDGFYKGRCLRDTISSAQNSGECEKIDDSEHRNKCYIHVAEQTGDSNICKKIDDKSLQEKCYFWIAEQTGEGNICVGIVDVDLQKMCYVNLAEKTGDASFCDKITDNHIGDKCYRDVAIATNDVSLCEEIISDQGPSLNPKDECYASIGIQTNDRSLCEKVIWEEARQKCFDNTS